MKMNAKHFRNELKELLLNADKNEIHIKIETFDNGVVKIIFEDENEFCGLELVNK
ncbi:MULTISPECIES: hypothetical protein [unclassified Clostridium]|uniref:hypothetical protein n=1 Tax=unclassified Clostridium TaxID=2614128 RepID=UPI0025BF97DB|nr:MULTISPECIES: hypothetical protein [unclassified Clostridium]